MKASAMAAIKEKMVTLHTSLAFCGFSSFHTKYRITPSNGDRHMLPTHTPAFSSLLSPSGGFWGFDRNCVPQFAHQCLV
ncbi:MAG: hypothetical protein KGZ66_03715 [Selenomonadales bacterium]|nr:hypothetical protein [Selenomonadales bacterium]